MLIIIKYGGIYSCGHEDVINKEGRYKYLCFMRSGRSHVGADL